MMRLPVTLSFYIGRQYFLSVLFVLVSLLLIVGMFDGVELVRRASSKPDVTIWIVLEMLVFKLPSMGEKLVPFAGLIGGMLALSRLTKTHELIVARAAGVSVWQFLMPAFLAMLLFGSVFVMAYNPVSATMLARFEQMELKYFSGRTSMLAVSKSGLWLRQVERDDAVVKEHVIHALGVADQGRSLNHVTIFSFDEGARFISRVDADRAILAKGHWQVQNALVTKPGEPSERKETMVLDTDLTVSQIQDSFASPNTLTFWQLYRFISDLEQAGFSALRHKLQWHALLSVPFLLCAMAFLAASFSLRLPRRGGMRKMVVAALGSGFFFFFMRDIVQALGLAGNIPVWLAAWAPTLLVILAAAAVLLHTEDG